MRRAVALPSRAVTLGNLTNTVKTLTALVRQSYGLTDDSGDGRAPEAPRVIEWVIVDPTDASAAGSENGLV